MKSVDVVVIGAGPAGMSAATTLHDHGADVLVLDEQPGPGGQIYRGIEQASATRMRFLGKDYQVGESSVAAFKQRGIRYQARATVWRVEQDGTIYFSVAGDVSRVFARHIIAATGALERPVPVPGWTLPGVMTVGAAQILLKTSGVVSTNAVLVGSGPLLYLVASQMIAAGVPPKALVETQTTDRYWRALWHASASLLGWRTLLKGVWLLRTIRAAGVKRYTGANAVEIHGDCAVSGIGFNCRGKAQSIACTSVFLHQGVVPNTQITRSLGLAHRWHQMQRCFHPVTDAWGLSSAASISIAGDGARIAGAEAASFSGQLLALNVLEIIGKLSIAERDEKASPLRRAMLALTAPRRFLDELYAVPDSWLNPADSTIVCRCEEVTAGDIRRFAKAGCVGPNQTKAFGRCGMGPCQGRYCGLTVTNILATENAMSEDQVGMYRIRSPIKPITLGELASLTEDQSTS